jgi:tetratricopeptide (TPR) repeat protein
VHEAVAAYAESERALEAAGLPLEAVRAAVDRIDALAHSGRVDRALSLATSLRSRMRGHPKSFLTASLDVNRGNVLRLRGDLDDAVRAYDAAARDLSRLGSAYGAAVARKNSGVALAESGDADGALAVLRRAAADLDSAGFPALALEARANEAWAQIHAGELGRAIASLERLARGYEAEGMARHAGQCRIDLADALWRSGDRVSAEREALRAAADFVSCGGDAERAEALWLAAAAASDRPSDASQRLAEARRAAGSSGRPAVVLRCDVLSADLALRRGRRVPLRRLDALAARADRLSQRPIGDDARLVAATVALEGNHPGEAARRFSQVVATARGRPWAALAAETGLASIEARSPERRASALVRLRRIARFLDAVRGGLPGAWLRASFVAERLDPYLARVEILLERGRARDRREAEALLDALGARRFLEARPPRVRAAFARARRRLEAAYDRLARADAPSRGDDAPVTAVLAARARDWERELAEAWRREERSAEPGEVTDDPVPASLDAATAVVHLWRRGPEVRALLRVGDDVGRPVSLGSAFDLEGEVEALRLHGRRWIVLRGSEPLPSDAAKVERVLERLADGVLQPLRADEWPRHVLVVSDPSLPDLPWELLPHDGGRLGESRRVLRVPAASVSARRRPRGRGIAVVAAGDPGLPGIAREVASIAAASQVARVAVGSAATRAAALESLASNRVVHLAGHGWDAAEAPALAGVRLSDGWLTVADLPRTGVAADLVVLSACRTGKPAGRATLAWGGLVTALLSAGARRVLWSLDDVDDDATARLMSRFHRERSEADDVSAFGRALAATAREIGDAASMIAFRLTGVRT